MDSGGSDAAPLEGKALSATFYIGISAEQAISCMGRSHLETYNGRLLLHPVELLNHPCHGLLDFFKALVCLGFVVLLVGQRTK